MSNPAPLPTLEEYIAAEYKLWPLSSEYPELDNLFEEITIKVNQLAEQLREDIECNPSNGNLLNTYLPIKYNSAQEEQKIMKRFCSRYPRVFLPLMTPIRSGTIHIDLRAYYAFLIKCANQKKIIAGINSNEDNPILIAAKNIITMMQKIDSMEKTLIELKKEVYKHE